MTRIAFDLESNGFLDDVTTIHCICTKDLDSGKETAFGPFDIDKALTYLMKADELLGHNILAYDCAVIAKLYPHFNTTGIKITDTLVLSRLIRADLRNDDHAAGYTLEQLHKRLYGSHSLKAWGLRLGVLKGDYGETSDWSTWTKEMETYCQQDVRVTVALWKHLAPETWSQQSINLEHALAEICHRIGQAGWTFDKKKAGDLYAALAQERAALQTELDELFPPWTIETPFVPKVNNSKLGYVKGETFTKRKEVRFNPNSRKHIEFCLKQKYGWKPKDFTPSGDAKIDETVLNALPYPEAKKLAHSFLLQKRIGMLSEGNSAWMKLAKDDPQSPRYGLLRHTINPNGTVTGRASHFGPNLAQVPATRAPYGKECRELFTVPPGYSLVGSDLSGLELRCLAHFLNDGGAYAKEVIDGDVHTANMAAAGLATRDQAKTFIYALLYGAGDTKIGSIVGGSAREGRKLRQQFLDGFPAFASLLRAVKGAVDTKGHLVGLDYRRLVIRSEHAALNTLLQSAGALICKKWVQLIDENLSASGIDAEVVAWVHDEVQVRTRKGYEQDVGNRLKDCARKAGEAFNFTVPIDAEYGVGPDWSSTH